MVAVAHNVIAEGVGGHNVLHLRRIRLHLILAENGQLDGEAHKLDEGLVDELLVVLQNDVAVHIGRDRHGKFGSVEGQRLDIFKPKGKSNLINFCTAVGGNFGPKVFVILQLNDTPFNDLILMKT